MNEDLLRVNMGVFGGVLNHSLFGAALLDEPLAQSFEFSWRSWALSRDKDLEFEGGLACLSDCCPLIAFFEQIINFLHVFQDRGGINCAIFYAIKMINVEKLLDESLHQSHVLFCLITIGHIEQIAWALR